MSRISFKLPALLLVIIFIFVMFIPIHASNDYHSIEKHLKGSLDAKDMSSGSDPSVHLYVNGNGYVVYSANYSVDGIISYSFDNDRSQSFTTNDVPTGTVFHLVSSPNAGYTFQKWVGSVNSTSNSIYVTVNQNINEEAIYQKEPVFSVAFTESGLPTGDSWWVNFNGHNITSFVSTITFDISDGTYGYTVQSMGTYGVNYDPELSSGTVLVSGYNQTEYIYYYPEYYLHVTASPSGYGLITPTSGWYSSGEYLDLLATPNNGYAFSSWEGTGSGSYTGTSDSASITMNGPINETATFYIPVYTVAFTESGLPTGDSWWVNFNGHNITSFVSTITFDISAGRFDSVNVTAYNTFENDTDMSLFEIIPLTWNDPPSAWYILLFVAMVYVYDP